MFVLQVWLSQPRREKRLNGYIQTIIKRGVSFQVVSSFGQ
jgi:hypothetical protein